MKKLCMLLLALMAFSFINAQTNPQKTPVQKKTGTEKISYTCPMHPDVVSDKPGKCSKCGMNLVEKKMAAKTYVCPMHPDVVSDKPGKCSKCGMNLVEKKKTGKMKM
ncbi:MAG: hypothetical protein KGO92_09070 [Bacteroidota bacterium]|nr:hypothetical protein [Bacteroidota bacterium]